MYDIEKDVENVAEWLKSELKEDWAYERERVARNILNASTAVQELKELQDRYNAQDSLLSSVLETNTVMGRKLKEQEEQIESMHRQYDTVDSFRCLLTPPKQKG